MACSLGMGRQGRWLGLVLSALGMLLRISLIFASEVEMSATTCQSGDTKCHHLGCMSSQDEPSAQQKTEWLDFLLEEFSSPPQSILEVNAGEGLTGVWFFLTCNASLHVLDPWENTEIEQCFDQNRCDITLLRILYFNT